MSQRIVADGRGVFRVYAQSERHECNLSATRSAHYYMN